jgi:hypothetical protein
LKPFANLGEITSAAFSANSNLLLYGTEDRGHARAGRPHAGSMRLWDIKGRKQLRIFNPHRRVGAVAFAPGDKQVLSASGYLRVRNNKPQYLGILNLWDIEGNKFPKSRRFGKHNDPIRQLVFSADGSRLFAQAGPMVLSWNFPAGDGIHSFPEKSHLLAFTRNGGPVLLAGLREARLCDKDGQLLHAFRLKWNPKCMAISADGRRALVGCSPEAFEKDPKGPAGPQDHTVHLLDLEKHRELARFEGHTHRIWSVAFLPNGKFALSGSDQGTIRLWDLKSFAPGAKNNDQPVKKVPPKRGGVLGLRVKNEINCLAQPRRYRLAKDFQFDKDWQLTLEYLVPDRKEQIRILFAWGNGKVNQCGLAVWQQGVMVNARFIDGTVKNKWSNVQLPLRASMEGKWIKIGLTQKGGMVLLDLDGKEKRKWFCDVLPKLDEPGPALVGAAPSWPPHPGRVRNLLLENTRAQP